MKTRTLSLSGALWRTVMVTMLVLITLMSGAQSASAAPSEQLNINPRCFGFQNGQLKMRPDLTGKGTLLKHDHYGYYLKIEITNHCPATAPGVVLSAVEFGGYNYQQGYSAGIPGNTTVSYTIGLPLPLTDGMPCSADGKLQLYAPPSSLELSTNNTATIACPF